MSIKLLIESIIQKHKADGIEVFPPASEKEIITFEKKVGFALPDDFREFYSICNGFGCNEDIFNMIPLGTTTTYPDDYGPNWFHFAEYMIYSDGWSLRMISPGQYEIFNDSYPKVPLTTSLGEFLERFLRGNVFDAGGLYQWQDEIGIK